MASGQTIGKLGDIVPPSTNYPGLTAIAGGSSPPEQFLCYAFDASVDEFIDLYYRILENYSNGGCKLQFNHGSGTGDGTKNIVFKASFRRLVPNSTVLTSAFTYSTNEQSITTANVGTANHFKQDEIAFTNGTQMDNAVAGDLVVIRFWRDADNASDTLAADNNTKRYGFRLVEQ